MISEDGTLDYKIKSRFRPLDHDFNIFHYQPLINIGNLND